MVEAMHPQEERERQFEILRSKLQVGLDELERGEGVEWTTALMEQISHEVDEMLRRGVEPDPDVCP